MVVLQELPRNARPCLVAMVLVNRRTVRAYSIYRDSKRAIISPPAS
jgi:hypothetical protein